MALTANDLNEITEDAAGSDLRPSSWAADDERPLSVSLRGEGYDVVAATELGERVLHRVPANNADARTLFYFHGPSVLAIFTPNPGYANVPM